MLQNYANGSRFDFVEELDQETMEKDEEILGLVSSSGSQVDIPSIYSNIIQEIKLACNILCLKNDRWMRCFGRSSWPCILELIIAHFLSKGETRKNAPFKARGSKEDFSEQVVQLFFLSERCIISKAGAHLMESVHQTIRQESMEFYHAARDTLLLYEAICDCDELQFLYIPIKLQLDVSERKIRFTSNLPLKELLEKIEDIGRWDSEYENEMD
ncbi:Rzz complex, partial [Thalictrum thalictroides]